ncbi:MAG: hypothetical protein CMH49_01525 [Myxococcales bacterium]|nr:hypothetical protein [Myxococcales bacterium]
MSNHSGDEADHTMISDVDPTEKLLKYSCGALFAIIFSLSLVVDLLFDKSGFTYALFTLPCVFIFGFLSMRHGNCFWYALKEYL